MSSSQPVNTPNALNFTPDNKHCYAYSGPTLVGDGGPSGETTVIEFTTTSYYAVGDISIFVISDTTDDLEFLVKLNDNKVMEMNTTSFKDYAPYQPIPLIIPPFTKVTLSGFNSASGSKNVMMNFTGKAIGLTDVGYQ